MPDVPAETSEEPEEDSSVLLEAKSPQRLPLTPVLLETIEGDSALLGLTVIENRYALGVVETADEPVPSEEKTESRRKVS